MDVLSYAPVVGAVCLLIGLVAPVQSAEKPEPIKEIMPNGMTLIVEENHAAPVVAARIYTKTGSAYEGESLGAGLSHFLEHVLGEGSEKRTSKEIKRTIEEIGNESNAYTSHDHTCYYITTGSQFLDRALDVLADYVTHPKVPPEEVEKQRGIILREMAMRDDEPSTRLYDLFQETQFTVHPSRYRIIGYPDLFQKVTYDDLFRYHRERYVPDNMVCVVAGDVAAAHALELMRKAFGALPRRPPQGLLLPAEPRQMAPQRRVMVEPDLKKAYLVLGYHTVSLRHPDLYPLDVLSYILAKGTASRLVRVLRDEKKLVDAVGCWSQTPRYDAGSFVVSATLDPANLAAAEEAILAELEQVKTKPITKAELAKAKAQVAAERVFDEERVEDKASALGSGEVSADDPQFNDRYVKGIQTVTATDVLRVAQEYFLPEGYTFCALTPSAASAQVAKAGAAPGAIQLRKLPDGAKLLVQPSGTVPLVTLSAVFAGGLRYETAESNGISELTSDLLVRGTKRRTREQLNRELESVGGSISPWVGRDSLGLTVQVLKQDFGRGLEVLADAIENSTFPPEELETVRKLQLASIAAEQDDAFSPTFRLLFEQLFSAHPYRFQKVGTAESVAKLTREQVVAYYHLICRPGNMILCVFGDVGADEAEAAATEAFRSFPAQPTEPAQPPAEAPLATVHALTKERPQEQAVLVWGFRGMKAGDPDRYALDVMDAAFSGMGMPGGRLHETLRGQALVYATHLVTYSLTDPGFIIMYAATAPDKVEKTEQAVTKLVADLRQAPMSPEEIERGQTMCVAHHELGLQSNSARALTAALDELRGLGYDQFLKYSERIEKVTAADVQRVAQQYLTLDACAYVKTLPAKQRP